MDIPVVHKANFYYLSNINGIFLFRSSFVTGRKREESETVYRRGK